jgi:fructose-1,6-bisphosphatase I
METNTSKQTTLNTNPITLTFHLTQGQKEHKEATGDFTQLMSSIATACKFISSKVRKAGLANLYGSTSSSNTTGDIQKKLDVIANEVFINSLRNSQQVCIIASEEEEHAIMDDMNPHAKYIVTFDPLDGSSNIDANVTIGSIFGIYKRKSTDKPNVEEDLLQTGENIIASGYCVYGSSTQLVLCIEKKVNGYTLDPSLGEFILTHPDICIPKRNPIYSINEGNEAFWDEAIRSYVISKKHPEKGGKVYSLRYIGSMVADVHRTLLYGGIFMYPTDSKSPEGKLRLIYECNPLSYVIESAGGKSFTGKERVLDIKPTKIHQKCGIIMGSLNDVEDVEKLYASINK